MKQGKYLRKEDRRPRRRRRGGYQLTVILLVLALILGGTVGGTLAYLTAQTTAVENTFTVGRVGDLTLTDGKTHTIVPGYDIAMDPLVTYEGNNIPAYVFVQVDVTGEDGATGWTFNADTNTYTTTDGYMSWTVDTASWTKVADNVFAYKTKVEANVKLTEVPVVKNNTITVSDDITEGNIQSVADKANTVQFSAWAIQADGFKDAAAAWAAAGTN